MNNHRGFIVDPQILDKAKAFFGESFDPITDTRLMAYIDYCVKNGGTFNPRQLKPEEVDIMSNWVMKGWVALPDIIKVNIVSKDFYMIMSEILWDAYVEKDK